MKNPYKWNQETINILDEYIMDFQELFSNYLSKEQLIERLTKDDRLKGGIEYVTNDKIKTSYESDAAYSPSEKKIKLSIELKNKDNKYLKYVLFHELTHVVSMCKNNNKEYTGFQENNTLINIGLNEAMTEYLTQLRNTKYDYNGISDYRVVMCELENIMQLIGKEKIIDCYFNCPYNIESLFEEAHMNFKDITSALDNLIGKDQTIYEVRNKYDIEHLEDINILFYKRMLYEEYSISIGSVTNEEQFKRKTKIFGQNLNKPYSLNNIDEYSTYIELLCDIEELVGQGYEEEYLLNIMYENGFLKNKVDNYIKLNPICGVPFDEHNRTEMAIELSKIYKENKDDYFKMLDDAFISVYYSFNKEKPENNNELYDYYKYALIGNFLNEHEEYDYDEIEINKIGYKIETGFEDYFYLINTYNNDNYIMFEKYDDGSIMQSKRINNYTFEIFYNDIRVEIKIDGFEIKLTDMNEKNNIEVYNYYNKISIIDYFLNSKENTQKKDYIEETIDKIYDNIFSRKEALK